jgi:tetratricopeptide (TPR) repeat protein
MKKILKISLWIFLTLILIFVVVALLSRHYGMKCFHGEGSNAIAACDKLSRIMPTTEFFGLIKMDVLHRKAELCEKSGDKTGIVDALEKIVKLDENGYISTKNPETKKKLLVDVYEKLSNTYYDLNKPDKAIEYAEKTVQFGSKNPLPYIKLAIYLTKQYVEKNQTKENCENIKRYLEISKDLISKNDKLKSVSNFKILMSYLSACSCFCEGNILDGYYHLNIFKSFLAGLNMSNEEKKAMIVVAESMMNLKTQKRQQEFIIKSGQIKLSQSAMKFYKEGMKLFKKGDYSRAIKYFDETLSIDPNSVETLSNKCTSLQMLKKYDLSKKCLDEALNKNPTSWLLWNNKGVLMFKLKKYDEAESCFNKAISLNRNFAEAWGNAGILNLYKKDYQKALIFLSEYIRLGGTDKNYLQGECQALDGLGENVKSAQCYKAIAK